MAPPNTEFTDPPAPGLAACASWTPLAMIFAASLGAAALTSARPQDSGRLAAVFPPWWTAERALTAVSSIAPAAGFGDFPFIVAVSGAEPGLAQRLERAGAVLVLDGAAFTFCSAF